MSRAAVFSFRFQLKAGQLLYKYYVAYKLIAVQEEQRRKAKEAFEKKPS